MSMNGRKGWFISIHPFDEKSNINWDTIDEDTLWQLNGLSINCLFGSVLLYLCVS